MRYGMAGIITLVVRFFVYHTVTKPLFLCVNQGGVGQVHGCSTPPAGGIGVAQTPHRLDKKLASANVIENIGITSTHYVIDIVHVLLSINGVLPPLLPPLGTGRLMVMVNLASSVR